MKRKPLGLVLILILGSLSWGSAQTTRTDLFDAKKTEQELEIMKGILGTTLRFASRDLGDTERAAGFRGSFYGGPGLEQVSAYYLYGQGATFVIPLASLRLLIGERSNGRFAFAGDLEASALALAETERAMEDARREMERLRDERRESRAEYEEAVEAASTAVARSQAAQPPAPPSPPAPPTPKAVTAPVPARRQALTEDEIRKRTFEAQEKLKQRREQAEQRRQKLLQSVEELKGYLVEALANHGDSLTQLKPGEYINIIILTDDGAWGLGADRGDRQVISVQKSWISDYKAGRLTLEAFRQKALVYRT